METHVEYTASAGPKPTWKVPLADVQAQYLSLKGPIDQAIAHVLEKGNYVAGEQVEAFEEEWARFCGAKYCVGVSSCTDALYLALLGLGLPSKSNILTTPLTFFATTQAIISAGHTPRFMDVEQNGNIDLAKRPRAIGRACLPVHLYGRPAPITKEMPIPVIEDAAQGHGLPLRGMANCSSFYPTKNLGAMGQAGAVVTNDADMAKRVRELRTYGERERFVHHALTGNHRMDEIQAAILRVKLPYLASWNAKRREVAALYQARMADLPGIVLPEGHPDHVYHIYALRVTDRRGRDSLAAFLKAHGIQTAVRYPAPMHLQPALAHLGYKKGDFPMAEEWADTNLSLPMYPELTLEHVEEVAKAVKEWATCE